MKCVRSPISKEIFDKVVAFIAPILLLPLFLVVAVLIKIDSKGPVFFMQERVGKNGEVFKTFKFRTMYTGADKKTRGVYIDKENPYVTKVGRILRRTGIDEIPHMINMLNNTISFLLRLSLVFESQLSFGIIGRELVVIHGKNKKRFGGLHG